MGWKRLGRKQPISTPGFVVLVVRGSKVGERVVRSGAWGGVSVMGVVETNGSRGNAIKASGRIVLGNQSLVWNSYRTIYTGRVWE